ncbi:hypothetical protein METBIDRAFT_45115 [Metschnikowia bicuspidata var. bicuspidata NRRL YB-4993]|uniref:RA-domain-containing protein n=1 Tax=Metschnikowia bicuspidata var. bicuspidata NRRL YB-4993 TaxID=869754 RepID=A0A1A0H7Q1_9ASCO|nr:hypothetical protein METBIDRAFT_45115 [Metschnikowia bicuspidata var. bicuspidata NRRL YB-4993]OBA20010.1 hypothetical protein METBIDRAFT_45115 [Metschnikowia bicuspidata var. bicuspidata NRRL YB-4993]
MPEPFLEWDPAQVAQYFLEELGKDLTSSFIEHNIDGSILPFLTTGHLRELGIELLASRLQLKKKINELLASNFASGESRTLQGNDLHLSAIDINSNYVSMEALSLCLILLRDLSLTTRQISDDTIDMKNLSEQFKKLKMDLNPVIRLAKDSKPLPMPTLDPGVSLSLPTHSVGSIQSTQSWLASDLESGITPTTATTLILPEPSASKLSSSPNAAESSPTHSYRFSSGSVLSVGVGKIADMKTGLSSRFPPKPRLVEAQTSPANTQEMHEGHKVTLGLDPSNGVRPVVSKNKVSSTLVTAHPQSVQSGLTNQPLKQLKASSDDTCLKVLQHAMKRHHIPREKWSKYVLVVCYGDKERILKLTEKPVMIFKDLQEHGQNPTIMLRERASTFESDGDFDDSRIGNDIPGGRL